MIGLRRIAIIIFFLIFIGTLCIIFSFGPLSIRLAEAFGGAAVFIYDPQTGQNHEGKTTANNDENRGLDFVQKMMNHIIAPLRTPVQKSNQENTIVPDGIYGDPTMQTLQALIEGGTHTIGNKTITLATDLKINHKSDKPNAPKTFLKLVKDYDGLKETDIGKVIDSEVLIGLRNTVALDENNSAKDKHPVNDDDIGIYELYECDDWDEDGISNYIEVANSGGDGIAFDPLKSETNSNVLSLVNTVSRGSRGYGELVKAEAVGVTTSLVPENQRSNGLRLPRQGKGYYQMRGGDVADTDNYAVLSTLQKIEAIGKKWAERHPDLSPLNADVFLKDGGNSGYDPGGSGGIRFGIGDISRAKGRVFDPHNTHQNGLDLDVRYMRKEQQGEGGLDFVWNNVSNYYDENLTKELMGLFAEAGAVEIYITFNQTANILPSGVTNGEVTFPNGVSAYVARILNHDNHFHVGFNLANPPVGDINLQSSSGSIPANGQATVTITSDVIKDRMGWPLLEGTRLTVTATNENGQPIGQLPIDAQPTYRGKQLAVNSQAKLSFTYKAGNTLGIATIRIYVDYGKSATIPQGLLGQVQVTLTNP